MSEISVTTWLVRWVGRRAAATPRTVPKSDDRNSAASPNKMVTGSASRITSVTGLLK